MAGDSQGLAGLDAQALLAGILEELRVIREQVGQAPPSPQNISCAECNRYHIDGPRSPDDADPLSKESRTGPLLREALHRYRTDAVPQWSTLYGAHLTSPEPTRPVTLSPDPNTTTNGTGDPAQSLTRKASWEPIVGECWQIPHDNRVSLCFLSGPSDPVVPIRVRNFLHHFHDAHPRELPRGRHLNVWDWFDGGVSTQWYPHKSSPELESDVRKRARIEDGLPQLKEGGQGLGLSQMIAPWRRIISLQGLTSIRNGETAEQRARVRDDDLCPFFLPHSHEAIFALPVDDMVWRAVKTHLRCQRAGEASHAELATKGCLLFHVTFYEILGGDYEKGLTELWPCGELYGDVEGGKRVRESALTIIAIPSAELPNARSARAIFWTMICLRPTHFPQPYYFERRDDLARGHSHDMVDDMADISHKCLVTLIDRWDAVADYFEDFFCEKRALLNPAFHDTLLTDDATLSRSKKYFWAIEFLKELEKSVLDNIRQADRFVGLLREHPPPSSGGRHAREYESRLKRWYTVLTKLELLRVRFAQRREEAVALRDGLFNASAVMESRMSTKLGENIKLLTFVSIFFLPLSFCTSLWSVSDALFSLSALAATMPVLAVATYILTLNLDTMVAFWARLTERNTTSTWWTRTLAAWWSRIWPAGGDRDPEPGPARLGEVHVHVEVEVHDCERSM